MVVTIPAIMVFAVLHIDKMVNLEKFDRFGILKIERSYLCQKIAGLLLHSQTQQFSSSDCSTFRLNFYEVSFISFFSKIRLKPSKSFSQK